MKIAKTFSLFTKTLIAFFLIGIFFIFSAFWYFSSGLPDYKKLSNYEPSVLSRVYTNNGNLVALDTTQKLLDRIQTKKVTFKIAKNNLDKNLALDDIKFKFNNNNTITAIYEKNSHDFEDIIEYLKEKGVKTLDIVTEDGDLEDVFIQLTKNN